MRFIETAKIDLETDTEAFGSIVTIAETALPLGDLRGRRSACAAEAVAPSKRSAGRQGPLFLRKPPASGCAYRLRR